MPIVDIVNWVASWTPAQRDAVRTISLAIGSGCVPLFGFILTWLARIIRRETKQTVDNTRTADFVGGTLIPTSVAEMARKVFHNTQELRGEFRSEITDLINDPRSMPVERHGRRRDTPTNPVPSQYIGANTDD